MTSTETKNAPQKKEKNIARVFAAVSSIFLIAAPVATYSILHSVWAAGIASLIVAIIGTSIPIVYALLHKVDVSEAPVWIENTKNLGDQHERVIEHYGRIKGTLVYWKNEAAAYHRLDTARVVWSLISAVALPVLLQYYDQSDALANAFLTILTTWTGLVVSLAYTLKAEQKYQGMRQQESDFYDVARSLLDNAKPNEPQLKEKVDNYITRVEANKPLN